MSYEAQWKNADGTPATGFTFANEAQPGQTYTLTRRLHNTGTDPFDLLTKVDSDEVQVSVGGTALTSGVAVTTPVPAGEFVEFVVALTVPVDADPGRHSMPITVRALA